MASPHGPFIAWLATCLWRPAGHGMAGHCVPAIALLLLQAEPHHRAACHRHRTWNTARTSSPMLTQIPLPHGHDHVVPGLRRPLPERSLADAHGVGHEIPENLVGAGRSHPQYGSPDQLR
jgi:hypothetical protein